MPDQMIQEFRDRAERAIAPPDPGLLQQRGRALRRRRQVMPILALVVCGAVGVGIANYAAQGGTTSREVPPATPRQIIEPNILGITSEQVAPGSYTLDNSPQDGRADATVELVGEHWYGWSSGAHIENVLGTVSWGLKEYQDVPIEPCHPNRHATSKAGAINQLTELPGRVTQAPRATTALGLPATHLQVSVPVDVTCGGTTSFDAYLMAMWEGPSDPKVTVDVWLLEDGDRLLLLTKGVRGEPSPEMLDNLDATLNTLRLAPTQ